MERDPIKGGLTRAIERDPGIEVAARLPEADEGPCRGRDPDIVAAPAVCDS